MMLCLGLVIDVGRNEEYASAYLDGPVALDQQIGRFQVPAARR